MQLLEQIEKKQSVISRKIELSSVANKKKYQELYDRLEAVKQKTLADTSCCSVHLNEEWRELTEYENKNVLLYLDEAMTTEEEKLALELDRIKQ